MGSLNVRTLLLLHLAVWGGLGLHSEAVRALQTNSSDKCTSNSSCFFGGICNTATGICACQTGFTGNLCSEFLFSVCNAERQYPVQQKEDPTVIPVVCQNCDSTCFMCNGTTATDCIECDLTSSLTLLQNQACVASCTAGFVQTDQFYCDPCHFECATCDGTAQNSCLTCDQSSDNRLYSATLKRCFSTCPDGTYESGTNCLDCNSNCATCSGSATTCLTCPTGNFLYNAQCFAACPAGTTQTGSTCTTTCASNQFLASTNPDVCTPCNAACLTCSAAANTDCLTCATNNFFTQSGNTRTCGLCATGTFGNSATGFCSSCPPNCDSCSNATTCTTCSSGFFLLAGTTRCVNACPSQGYFLSNSVCTECNSNCRTCTGTAANQCTSCYTQAEVSGWLNVALSNNQCIAVCPDGTFLDNGVCQITCPSGQYLFNNNCLVCPSSLTGLTN